jgi:hypothetical protein
VILIYPSKASDQAQFGQKISGVARLAMQCPFIWIKFIFRSLDSGSRATDFDQEFSSREGESGLVLVGHGHSIKENLKKEKLFLHLFLFFFLRKTLDSPLVYYKEKFFVSP